MTTDQVLNYLMNHPLSTAKETAQATGVNLTEGDLYNAEQRGMVTRAGHNPQRWSLTRAGFAICKERLRED